MSVCADPVDAGTLQAGPKCDPYEYESRLVNKRGASQMQLSLCFRSGDPFS